MRLLLLLTAFISALTGVVTGASASPQAVQTSTLAEQARVTPAASIAPVLRKVRRGGLLPGVGAIAPADSVISQERDTFGERRRE